MTPDLERCPYCGVLTDNPCDEPPPDVCPEALRLTFEQRTLSQRMRDAGFTRRPSWRSLPKDGDD